MSQSIYANIVEGENVNISLIDKEYSQTNIIENEPIEVSIDKNNINVDLGDSETIEADIIGGTTTFVPYDWQQDVFILTAGQIASKAINLTHTPINELGIFFEIESSIPQIRGRSWELSGSSIIWNGLDLDGILEIGDVISVRYEYK